MKLLRIAKSHPTFLSLLLYLIGLVWLLALSQIELSYETYMSENALITGGVKETFYANSHLTDYNKEMKTLIANSTTSAVHEWLSTQFTAMGLECYTQDFQFQHGLLQMPKGQSLSGTNFYSIMRSTSGGGNRVEALLITVPMTISDCISHGGDSSCSSEAVGLSMALAKLFRKQNYWAKDIIFLFPEFDFIGTSAWLAAYHGIEQPTTHLSWSDLTGRSGIIQVGLNLELFNLDTAKLTLHAEGVDGLLANLDLVNTCVRLASHHSLDLSINDRSTSSSKVDRRGNLIGLSKAVWNQASGSPTGLHGLPIKYQIPSVTLRSAAASSRRSTSSSYTSASSKTNLGRFVEGVLRSLNNLQERLHQSFWFYLLPHPSRYVSIGVYMPPVLILIASLLIEPIILMVVVIPGGGDTTESVSSLKTKKKKSGKKTKSTTTKKQVEVEKSGSEVDKGSDDAEDSEDGDVTVRKRRKSGNTEAADESAGNEADAPVSKCDDTSSSPVTRFQPPFLDPSDLSNAVVCIFSLSLSVLLGLALYSTPRAFFALYSSISTGGDGLDHSWDPSEFGLAATPVMLDLALASLAVFLMLAMFVNPICQALLVRRFVKSPQGQQQSLQEVCSRCMVPIAWAFFLCCLAAFNVSTSLIIAVPVIPVLLLLLLVSRRRSNFLIKSAAGSAWFLVSPPCLVFCYCFIHELLLLPKSSTSGSTLSPSMPRVADHFIRCLAQSLMEADLFNCHTWALACLTSTLWMLTQSWTRTV